MIIYLDDKKKGRIYTRSQSIFYINSTLYQRARWHSLLEKSFPCLRVWDVYVTFALENYINVFASELIGTRRVYCQSP